MKERIVSSCAVAALLALLVSSPVAAQAPAAVSGSTPTVDVSRLRLDNFGQVSETYFRGAQPEGRDYADLAAAGIKTVIDLQADGGNHDEARQVEAAGMKFLRIPMTTRVAPTPEQIAQFLEVVNDPAAQPVYVHCKGGRHRTGVMSAIYRMENHQWTGERAFREMKQYDFGADFLHPEFKRFVHAYRPSTVAAEAPAPTPAAEAVTITH